MKIGNLFSGYGGLTMGIQAALGGTVAWNCDPDSGPTKLLAHRHPGVPNLGDITAVNWSSVEPVDVIEGGSPCQDVSHAGKRLGMRAGTRSGLWASMCDAIDTIRPGLVVWENVRGALSAAADSDVEPCPVCLGDERDVHLRALGRVLGDLAELGYDASWGGLRAADAGAPHGRFRVFVTAWPVADARGEAVRLRPGLRPGQPIGIGRRRPDHDGAPSAAADAEGDRRDQWRAEPARLVGGPHAAVRRDAAADSGDNGREGGEELHQWALLGQPSPLGLDADGRSGAAWGAYAPAVARWERATGRSAPAPTEVGTRGGQRLSAVFVEWLMGLPAGHVTAVPGLTRNEQLKLLGNGVVPQQAELALRQMLGAPHAAGPHPGSGEALSEEITSLVGAGTAGALP